jgi:hypothetical protein
MSDKNRGTWIGCGEAALWQQLPTDCVKTVVEYLDTANWLQNKR